MQALRKASTAPCSQTAVEKTSLRKATDASRDALSPQGRCRENMAHIRQSRPDSGLDFQVKVLRSFWKAQQWGVKYVSHGASNPYSEPTKRPSVRTQSSQRVCVKQLTQAETPVITGPLSREYGTYKTVKIRGWPWLSGKSPENVSCKKYVSHGASTPSFRACRERILIALMTLDNEFRSSREGSK